MIALIAAASAACGFAEPTVVGRLGDDKLDEVSGLVISRRQPGVQWVHNDSGDKAAIYALGPTGELLGTTKLEDVEAIDIEDIALQAGPEHDWLLVGDIGDNKEKRETVVIYRIPEPTPKQDVEPEVLVVRYPNGPRNAETLLVDPSDGSVLILTKVLGSASELYSLGPFKAGEVTAKKLGEVKFTTGISLTTGGDVRPDGKQLVIRTYTHLHLFGVTSTVAEALKHPPCSVTGPDEKQGEAVGYEGDALRTISEGKGAAVIRFAPTGAARTSPAAPAE